MGPLILAIAITGGWSNSGWAANPDLLPENAAAGFPVEPDYSLEQTSFNPDPIPEPEPEPSAVAADPVPVSQGRFDGARYYLADRYGREWQSTDWPQLWAWVQTQNMSVPQYQPVYQSAVGSACQTFMDPVTGRLYQSCPR